MKHKSSKGARKAKKAEVEEEETEANSLGYTPPSIVRVDTIDNLVHRIDLKSHDKYQSVLSLDNVISSSLSASTDDLGDASKGFSTGTGASIETGLSEVSPEVKRSRDHRSFASTVSSEVSYHSRRLLADDLHFWAEDEYYRVKQKFGFCSIIISAFQLLILMMQLALCGVAPLDVNPIIGPYPDAFSEWGGKNTYFIIERMELWRFITPAFLHVGVLHLLCNAAVQLETCAFFEREWGWKKWLLIYFVSEIACVTVSCVANPETIAVGSSGALMGLFGAKLAHVMTHTFMTVKRSREEVIRMEHLSGVTCSFAVISLLSFFTYIDWSGHMGGLAAGFLTGMVVFAGAVKNVIIRILWGTLGFGLLSAGLAKCLYMLFTETESDEDMADACEYFRNLYAEGYACECLWE